MIVITGAAGFIGSCLAGKLNNKGVTDLVLVDDFDRPDKAGNIACKSFREKVHRDGFLSWLEDNAAGVSFIFHLGARTDTMEFDRSVFDRFNLGYSKAVWSACVKLGIPLLYASSAATYGMGEQGYADDHDVVPSLKPLNPYGESKNDFDKWLLKEKKAPSWWAGMKFFNVYGPNEFHKGRMASVVFHAYNQIRSTGRMRLFRSHIPSYEDGKQLRDFIYVKDVVDVLYFMMMKRPAAGLYNLGTGKARTFYDLATAVFRSMDLSPDIEFIDTPADIRDKYQYFTEAKMDKLSQAGYDNGFYSLEEGVEEYVQEFLIPGRFF
jgi:ADP-L-glycero-D-manno-heptose 6-epimerase